MVSKVSLLFLFAVLVSIVSAGVNFEAQHRKGHPEQRYGGYQQGNTPYPYNAQNRQYNKEDNRRSDWVRYQSGVADRSGADDGNNSGYNRQYEQQPKSKYPNLGYNDAY